MISKSSSFFIAIAGLLIIFWIFFNNYQSKHTESILPPQTLPVPVLQIISGGHDQAMAQTLFYQTMFYNEMRAEQGIISVDQETSFSLLNTATEVDPYNMDCYYYAQALLSDQPDFIDSLNIMLRRGMRYRTWDHYLPWFLGVNYFFTVQDKKTAGEYFFAAAKLQPKTTLASTLGARALHQGSETEMAVLMLREMLQQSPSPLVKKTIALRLIAFETVLFLRKALTKYTEINTTPPASLNDLVKAHILKSIPPDPYGGEFYLDTAGAIQTTSKYVQQKK